MGKEKQYPLVTDDLKCKIFKSLVFDKSPTQLPNRCLLLESNFRYQNMTIIDNNIVNLFLITQFSAVIKRKCDLSNGLPIDFYGTLKKMIM